MIKNWCNGKSCVACGSKRLCGAKGYSTRRIEYFNDDGSTAGTGLFKPKVCMDCKHFQYEMNYTSWDEDWMKDYVDNALDEFFPGKVLKNCVIGSDIVMAMVVKAGNCPERLTTTMSEYSRTVANPADQVRYYINAVHGYWKHKEWGLATGLLPALIKTMNRHDAKMRNEAQSQENKESA